MKLFRQIVLLLVVVLALPLGQCNTIPVPENNAPAFSQTSHHLAKPLRYNETKKRHKRRPVALNDYFNHDRALIPLTTEIPYIVQSEEHILNGYYFNPYLSVPVALRSWRGPPVA